MIKGLERMIKEAIKAKDIIKNTTSRIMVVSHYDADGICSAAIMYKALRREGKDFHISIVKQLSENILENVSKAKPEVVIFTDLGSGQINFIKKHLSCSITVICDHHEPQGEPDESIIHINSLVAGIPEHISGSGVTYLFARTLNPENVDLSPLAIIGAIGDSQIDSIGIDWGLNGINKEILKEAGERGLMKVEKGLRLWGRYSRPLHKALEYSIDPYIPGISGSESAAVQFLQEAGIDPKKPDGGWRTISDLTIEEQRKLADEIIKERIRSNHENPEYVFGDVYELLDKPEEFRDANEFATMLNACGKMGKAYLGVMICLNMKNAYPEVKKVLEMYRREVGKGTSWLISNLKNPDVVKKGHGIYIFAGDNISEHIISNVVSIVNHSGVLPDKPIFGFANSEEGIKISARISKKLGERGINLKEILSELSEKLGGQGGGHMHAAGAVIAKGKEMEFMRMSEEKLSKILCDQKPENLAGFVH